MEKLTKKDIQKINLYTKEMAKAVNAGSKYLDTKFGRKDWLKKVNENVLKLSDANICITGQIFGDYFEWVSDEKMSHRKAVGLGFYLNKSKRELSLSTGKEIGGYELLTHLWYCKIASLRAIRGVKFTG